MTSRFAPTLNELEVRKPAEKEETAASSHEDYEGGAEMTKRTDKKAKPKKAAAKKTVGQAPGSSTRVLLTPDERRERATARSKRWYAANPGQAKEYRATARAKRLAASEQVGASEPEKTAKQAAQDALEGSVNPSKRGEEPVDKKALKRLEKAERARQAKKQATKQVAGTS